MLRPSLTTLIAALICAFAAAGPSGAESYHTLQQKRPDLFDPETGFRIARQRAPTPDDIPEPVKVATPEQARALLDEGALPVDVFSASQSRFDELDGTWLVSEPRQSLPGAIWLPEVGRGQLTAVMQRYLAQNLARGTAGDPARPIVVFCVADCWMSWNAAQRMATLGYEHVYWFRLGTDGWLDIGLPLTPVDPVPVDTN